mgnify:CR=1 FL=1
MQQEIIFFSFKVLKYFTFSPRINYTERWYTNQINKSWNSTDSTIITDTLNNIIREDKIH